MINEYEQELNRIAEQIALKSRDLKKMASDQNSIEQKQKEQVETEYKSRLAAQAS